MHQTGYFRLATGHGGRALELPYAGGGLALLLVLPNEVDGLPAVERSLDAAGLTALVAGLAAPRVRVALPKFEVNPPASLPLGETLKDMGLAVAFDRTKADFTGIANPTARPAGSGRSSTKPSSASTGGTRPRGSRVRCASRLPLPPGGFRADHPFLFYLLDVESGLVLFAGRVADPSALAR
jgi:serpin B